MAETILIRPGVPFSDAMGLARVTKAAIVMVDDAPIDPSLGGGHDVVKPIHRAIGRSGSGRAHYVAANHWTAIARWLETGVRTALPAPGLGEAGRRMLASLVLHHEVGHAILDSDEGDRWCRHVAEIWCDAYGTAMALALSAIARGTPEPTDDERDAIHAATAMHGPAVIDEVDPISTERVICAHEHDTLGACEAVLSAWDARPWDATPEACLGIAGDLCRLLAPEPGPDRAYLASLIRDQQLQGRRCILSVNERFDTVDLPTLVAKGVGAEELSLEMAEHLAKGVDIVAPRTDKPGGAIAAEALRLATLKHEAMGDIE